MKTAAHLAALRDLATAGRLSYEARESGAPAAVQAARQAAVAATSAEVDVHEALAAWQEAKDNLTAALEAAAKEAPPLPPLDFSGFDDLTNEADLRRAGRAAANA